MRDFGPKIAGNNHPDEQLPLRDLLENAELLDYLDAFKTVLKLRHAGDLCYTDQDDLDGIGMSRPEQKRLFREYAVHFPEAKGRKGFMGRIKRRMFGKDEAKASVTPTATETSRKDGSTTTKNNSKMAKKSDEKKQQQQHMNTATTTEDQQHIIPSERISLCREIGSGEFGSVFQAIWHPSGGEAVQVAVKRILPEKLISQPSAFLQEAAIMTRMHNENVVRLFGVVLDTKAVMLVSELAPCGSLLECLLQQQQQQQQQAAQSLSKLVAGSPFSIGVLCDFALQIAQGMRYLSEQRLIHRDLAARNVLVSSPTKVKISDFGLSRSLGHGEDYYRSEFNPTMKLPIAWCAPECINFLRFTSASDVWAYGVTLWEMFTFGQTPWTGMTGSQILHTIDTQRRKLDRPEACPAEIYDELILNCWAYEAERRPTFEQICDQLPTLKPPQLLTVAQCRQRKQGHLQYEKGQIITLLDKKTVYPGFWLGATETANVGIFRPEDTIAHLGAENPSSSTQSSSTMEKIATIKSSPSPIPTETPSKQLKNAVDENGTEKTPKSSKKKGEKDGKEERKKGANKRDHEKSTSAPKPMPKELHRKLDIGRPESDLRHTCHVGADGRSFGLLNIDKNDLPMALPPIVPTKSPPPLLMSDQISPIMYTSTISLAPPRPPKSSAMAASTLRDSPMSRSVCLDNGSSNAFFTVPNVPILPPKPARFRPRPSLLPENMAQQQQPSPSTSNAQIDYVQPVEQYSNNNSAGDEPKEVPPKHEGEVLPKHEGGGGGAFPLDMEERQRQIQRRSKSPEEEEANWQLELTKMEKKETIKMKKDEPREEEEEEEEEFLRPASICLEQLNCTENGAKLKKPKEEEEDDDDEERILNILTGLQRDLSEFSLTTLEDCSESRKLLHGERRREQLQQQALAAREKEATEAANSISMVPADRASIVVGMEPGEFDRMAGEERRRMEKQLGRIGAMADTGTSPSAVGIGTLRKLLGKEERKTLNQQLESSEQQTDLPRSTKEPLKNWSPEANEAYKLLVQCGHLLKDGAANGGGENNNHLPMPKFVEKSRTPTASELIPLTIQNPMANCAIKRTSPKGMNSPPTPTASNNTIEPVDIEYLNTSQFGSKSPLNGHKKYEYSEGTQAAGEYVNNNGIDNRDNNGNSIGTVGDIVRREHSPNLHWPTFVAPAANSSIENSVTLRPTVTTTTTPNSSNSNGTNGKKGTTSGAAKAQNENNHQCHTVITYEGTTGNDCQ